jgi:hypothetical protein
MVNDVVVLWDSLVSSKASESPASKNINSLNICKKRSKIKRIGFIDKELYLLCVSSLSLSLFFSLLFSFSILTYVFICGFVTHLFVLLSRSLSLSVMCG